MNRNNLILCLIIVFAVIFRFYRLWDFQYWSIDEEIFVSVVRKAAVEHIPILLSPNVAIATSLGSFFHLLSAPIFIIAGLTASKILIAGSILGVITTLAVYKTGKELFNRKVGQIAALLYACSFLVSFSDRRWWPLTLDPLLATLSVLSIFKLVHKDYKYALLLAICMAFAWHADPSLSVIIVFSLLSLVVFKIPLFKKQYIPAYIFLALSFAPFVIFELRHPGAISHPMLELAKRFTGSGESKEHTFNLISVIQGMARGFAVSPGTDIEKYLLYLKSYPPPPFSPLFELATLFFIIFPIFKYLKSSKSLKIVYLYLLSFFIGILVFAFGMKSEFHQHYFVIVWPIFFLLVAFVLSKASKVLAAAFLALFILANILTLEFSTMRFPLIVKERIVDQAIKNLKTDDFALKVLGGDRYFEGFSGLFYLRGVFPRNADYYEDWDWIYQAYSLYPVGIKKTGFKETITLSPGD